LSNIQSPPEKSIGASFNDEPLSNFGFWADWTVAPKWNLCNSPGTDGGKVKSVGAFLESGDQVLVCTHATFRFAVEKLGIEAFDDLAVLRASREACERKLLRWRLTHVN